MTFTPRPNQKQVIDYPGGRMGVMAVPGSGKTRTLSYLAAQLVAEGRLRPDQEVLIVTLVNSAVDHFARQVGEFVRQRGLLPNFGYRVRTLHGLANDIVRERPSLVGLEEGFQIIDERDAGEVLDNAVTAWLRLNPDFLGQYLAPEIDEKQYQLIKSQRLPDDVRSIANAFIRQAKDEQLLPEDIRRGLDRFRKPLPLAEMCWQIYADYERSLRYRGAVDFQDLMRLGLRALQTDEQLLARLRHRWAYILEDEAQDSSLLQERVLRLLAGDEGNWVRVGDPNQAIYETFTTASPEYLRRFMEEPGVLPRELPDSGRSTLSIIRLANYLVQWSIDRHPSSVIRLEKRPLLPPFIRPTPPGDPQPNPPDQPDRVHLMVNQPYAAAEEIEAIVKSTRRWLDENPDRTVAVLVPRNDRGAQVAEALRKANVEVIELLRSTSATRHTAGALALILEHLARPAHSPALAKVFEVWRRDDRDDATLALRVAGVAKVLQGCRHIEDLVYPRPDRDWLDYHTPAVELLDADETAREWLLTFRALLQRWQAAVVLPVDQLILTLAQDLFHDPQNLAIAHSLALLMRLDADRHPEWRLMDFANELKDIARNRRNLPGISDGETHFDPESHRGKVTVATVHRAKGLEWDRVYLMSVNNYDFPSGEPHDTYISERRYVRDRLNLDAEARAQLSLLSDPLAFEYVEGVATQAARADYVAERLRLLYVGITRARRELVITWNTGRDGKYTAATPLIALSAYWEKDKHDHE